MIAAQREAIFSGLGTSIGDPRTMAPEVVAGSLPSAQSDCYSAAVSLLWTIGLVDPIRHADALFGTEAIAARQSLKPGDWIGRGIDASKRDALIEKLSGYLEPELSLRRSVDQPTTPVEQANSKSESFWHRLKQLFRTSSEKSEKTANHIEESTPKERIKIPKKPIVIGIALTLPVFVTGVFVSSRVRKHPEIVSDGSHSASHSAEQAHSHSTSMSSTRYYKSSRKGEQGESDDRSNPSASSTAPVMNVDPEKCKKDIDIISKRTESELQFWGEFGDIILCGKRDSRSLCCHSLLHLQGCALKLNKRVVIDVSSPDENQLRIRVQAMQKEAEICGIGPGVVHSVRQGARRSVNISLAARTGSAEDG